MTRVSWCVVASLLLFGGLGSPPVLAQPKPGETRIIVYSPLGVPAGKTTRLTVRGLKLDQTTELRSAATGVTFKILNKSKVAVPNQQDPNRIGDSQIEAEVVVPADVAGEELAFSATTSAGTTPPQRLLIDRDPVAAEKEPNNGFRKAQTVGVGQVVEGQVGQGQDVDTFRFEGQAGQQLVIEVKAARLGSALDSHLTLYDAEGQILSSNDDFGDSTDSRLEIALPRNGIYYLGLIDANDQGGPAYGYRLSVKRK